MQIHECIEKDPGTSGTQKKPRGRPRRVAVVATKKSAKKTAPKSKKPKSKPAESKDPVAGLTDKVIREMSTYYSLAIQRHPDSLEDMKNEIWASYYHKISTDEFPQHEFCNYEWCKYTQNTAAGEEYTHPPPLDPEIQELVKEVYTSLTDEELLKRCLGKNNQNNNECYNSCLWQLAPKHSYVGKEVLELAAWISASLFNDGASTLPLMLKCMNVKVGDIALRHCERIDKNRLDQSKRRSTQGSKQGRIDKKKRDQELQKHLEEVEGLLYGPGID